MRPLSRPEPSDLVAARPRMGDVPFHDNGLEQPRFGDFTVRDLVAARHARRLAKSSPLDPAEAERLATWDRVLP